MLAAEKSKDTFIAPIGIGLSMFVVEIAGVKYTGASVNPARSFGPCVAAADFPGYHWIYWVGPFLGALIAGGFYHFIKVRFVWSPRSFIIMLHVLGTFTDLLQFFNYEDVNPGQDSAGANEDFNNGKRGSDLENGSHRTMTN
jgi:aquaporin related protein